MLSRWEERRKEYDRLWVQVNGAYLCKDILEDFDALRDYPLFQEFMRPKG